MRHWGTAMNPDEEMRGPETDGALGQQPPAAPSGGDSQGEPAPKAAPESGVLEFPVVGVGASAGGLEALEALFKRISLDSLAFVVVQHLSPDHESNLTQVLARSR